MKTIHRNDEKLKYSSEKARPISEANAECLQQELDWFNRVIDTRIALYFGTDCEHDSIYDIPVPTLDRNGSFYEQVMREFNMTLDERLVMLLALLPHIRPQVLDTFFIKNRNFDRTFTEFGGWRGNTHGGFLPTGETAAFILAGDDLKKRFEIARLFDPDHFFAEKNILRLEGQGTQRTVLFRGAGHCHGILEQVHFRRISQTRLFHKLSCQTHHHAAELGRPGAVPGCFR